MVKPRMAMTGVIVKTLASAPITAFLPGFQIWFMLLSRYMGWWPEPGVTWFDWIVALILPGYAIYQSLFG